MMGPGVKNDTIVIGAGISGLATAHYLTRSGMNVTVLERESSTGGKIASVQQDGFLAEYGPNSGLETAPEVRELVDDLELNDEYVYANDAAKNRYVVRGGRLRALPLSPLSFLGSTLFSPVAKLRLLREPFIAPGNAPDESLSDFVTRRLGPEFLEYAIDPFVSGVYAGTPDRLSVRAGFPKLYALEQRYGSLIKGAIKGKRERRKSGETAKNAAKMFSFAHGMDTLVKALTSENAHNIRTGANVGRIQRNEDGFRVSATVNGEYLTFEAGTLVLAVPAHEYASLPFETDTLPRTPLSKIKYPPVSVVYFGYDDVPCRRTLDGFGFLVPSRERRNILGTMWNSSLFANRAPSGGVGLTTFLGGMRSPERALEPDGKLVDTVRAELSSLLGIDRAPKVVIIKRWQQAIPQYDVGHVAILSEVDAFEKRVPGVFITGNFRGGISLSDCIGRARAISKRVRSHVANVCVH